MKSTVKSKKLICFHECSNNKADKSTITVNVVLYFGILTLTYLCHVQYNTKVNAIFTAPLPQLTKYKYGTRYK